MRATLTVEEVLSFHHDGWIVYRLLDDDGNLLYVGQTRGLSMRVKTHMSICSWFKKVDVVRVETRSTYRQALVAEARVIMTEFPLHNKGLPEVSYRRTFSPMYLAAELEGSAPKTVAALAGLRQV